jgi:hypothetical protein
MDGIEVTAAMSGGGTAVTVITVWARILEHRLPVDSKG